MEVKSKKKFYNTNWFMWITLIFVAPVGIFIMYRNKRFNKQTRKVLSIVFSIFWISMLIWTNISEKKEAAEMAQAQKVQEQKAAEEKEKAKVEAAKKAEQEKKEALNKPSKFEGITVGQENKLKEFIKTEAKKSIKKDGEFSDTWKIFKEGDLFTLMFSYITKERNVDVDNKFVATLNWDGSSEKLNLRKINSNPVIVLSNNHIVTLQTITKDVVKSKLKAPSTAKFPGILLGAEDWRYGATFKDAGEGNVIYQVQSYVDAQNSFGAMLRNNFNVVIEINWSTQKYTIKSVNIE